MHDRAPDITTAATPDAVLDVVDAAIGQGLFHDAASLTAGLTQAGWQRGAMGGMWVYGADPAWTLQSSIDPPGLSFFAHGQDALVASAADQVAGHLDGGRVDGLMQGEPDPDWRMWTSPAAVVSLNFTPTRTVRVQNHSFEQPCVLQLALERSDAPSEGMPADLARARRLAREGSAVQRWYLAAQEDLPDDVVQLLSEDGDPAVVTALEAGARQRHLRRERLEAGIEG